VCLVRNVDHMDPTPLYTQLANILRDMIKSGELQPRAPLPSESYLQQEQGVSRGTVRMAGMTNPANGMPTNAAVLQSPIIA